MERRRIRRLMEMMAGHGISEFSYSDKEAAIDIAIELPLHSEITSPQAGIFLHRHPGEKGESSRPRRVQKGEMVGYLKVGATLTPVVAAENGWLPEPFAGHGEVVGYGDLLF